MSLMPKIARFAGRSFDYLTPGSGTSRVTNFGRDLQLAEDYTAAHGGGNQSYDPNAPITKMGGSGTVLGDHIESGGYDSDGGGGGDNDTALALAGLDAQEAQLRDFLSGAGGQLDQGVTGINDDAVRLRNDINQRRGRTAEDLNLRTEETQRNKDAKLDTIDTRARTQAASLRNVVGRAAGSGSSAYKFAVPDAVTREASVDREDVQEDGATNFRTLAMTKKRADEDYTAADEDVTRQVNDKTKALREGVMSAQNDASASLADIARQKAALQSGNVRTAGAGYDADIAGRKAAMGQLFNTYRTPITAQAVKVEAPQLRDYVDNGAAVSTGGGNVPGPASSYDPFIKKRQEEFAY